MRELGDFSVSSSASFESGLAAGAWRPSLVAFDDEKARDVYSISILFLSQHIVFGFCIRFVCFSSRDGEVSGRRIYSFEVRTARERILIRRKRFDLRQARLGPGRRPLTRIVDAHSFWIRAYSPFSV